MQAWVLGQRRRWRRGAEIDRLVLAVNNAVDGARLSEAAGERVLDWMLLNGLGDFMHAGVLTEEVAALRSRYRPLRTPLHDVVLALVST